jgi:putative ABC transport system permease protein
MLRNYFKSAWRNILRDKTFSLINIFGLAVGLAACLLIGLYLKHEMSYDTFHKNSDRIYRLYIHGKVGNDEFKALRTSNVAKEVLVSEFSEVEYATRFVNISSLVEYGDKKIVDDGLMFADEDFFNVFSFPMVRGDSAKALDKPNQLVLTESAVKKYFGDEDPMGEMVKIGGEELYQVTGICKDVPENAHFSFDMLLSYSTSAVSEVDTWSRQSIFTYMLLDEHTDPGEFEEKLDILVTKYAASDFKASGNFLESLDPETDFYRFEIQPIEKIYLYSDLDHEIEAVGDINTVWFFSAIALFVLLIACINFMNLATARFSSRAKEVGIRKVVGSKKKQLIFQFLTESVLIVLTALVIGATLFEFSLPAFNNLTQKSLEINYLSQWYIIPALLAFSVLIGLLAGSYPAFFLSSFKPVKILKGSYSKGAGDSRLRGILVIVQFVITISLFVSTYIIYKQNHFMTNKDMGFNKERLLVLENTTNLEDKIKPFIEELRTYPQVSNVTGCYVVPGSGYPGYTMRNMKQPEDGHFNFSMNFVDKEYLKTLDMKLLEGRGFTGNFAADTGTVLINQTAAKEMGLENPLGEYLLSGNDEKVKIVGVLEDYHFRSLHKEVSPIAIAYYQGPYYRYITIRIKEGNVKETVNLAKDKWEEYVSNYPFRYHFLDSSFDQLYRSEKRTAKVLTIFSLLAIFIACLGLLGLSAFTVQKRIKEIGIRKVMGANISHVLILLYKEVFILLVISTVVAWPISYLVMNDWLDNFAFKIQPGVGPFIISTIAALLIAAMVTSFQALKAAWANPAYTLRDE